jgi:hypothetical protein
MPDPLQWCLFISLKGDWRQRRLCLDANRVCMEPLNRKVVVLSCVTYLLFQTILFLPFIFYHSEMSTKTMDQHPSFHQSLGGHSDEQLTALKAEIQQEAETGFVVGALHDSKNVLQNAVSLFAEKWHFGMILSDKSIECKRLGQTRIHVPASVAMDSNRKRRVQTNWIKCGCTFRIIWDFGERLKKQQRCSSMQQRISRSKFPPKVDSLDVAGGLTPGLSEPGNKSTGNLTV